MDGRKRTVQIKFRVTEAERDLILEKIFGELHGTTNVSVHGTAVVEAHGKLAGTLSNNGTVIVRGVFGGAQSGHGELILEENGYIKQPVIKNGMNYYEW